MCTVDQIVEAVCQILWHDRPPHIHDVIDGSGPHADIGEIEVDVRGEQNEASGGHLGPKGKFSGTARISPEGNVREVPESISFTGRCVRDEPRDIEFVWA